MTLDQVLTPCELPYIYLPFLPIQQILHPATSLIFPNCSPHLVPQVFNRFPKYIKLLTLCPVTRSHFLLFQLYSKALLYTFLNFYKWVYLAQWQPLKRYVYSESVKVTLFGKMVFADVIKDLRMRSSCIRVALNPITSVPIRKETGRKHGRKPCKDGGRGWSYPNQETSGATRTWKKEERIFL